MTLTEDTHSVKKPAVKRLVQQAIFRMGFKVQRLTAAERAAFVQFQRPDQSAIDGVFGTAFARLEELRRRYAAVNSPAAAHSVWTRRASDGNLADIGLAGVDLTRFRAGNSYVWNYYADSEDVARLQYYVFTQAVRSVDTAKLLDLLDEDGAFGCTVVEFDDGGPVSRDLLDSVAEINFLHRHLQILDADEFRVLDIGAGYGRFPHRLLTANARLTGYTCVDAIPESTFLCEFYLNHRGLQDRAEVIPLDEVAERLDGRTYDLAINIHGFSECTYGAIEWWLRRVRGMNVAHLMIVPNEQDHFLSTEPDGTRRNYRPLLTELGYDVVAEEPVFDPTVQSLLGVRDMMFLFRLRDAGGRSEDNVQVW